MMFSTSASFFNPGNSGNNSGNNSGSGDDGKPTNGTGLLPENSAEAIAKKQEYRAALAISYVI